MANQSSNSNTQELCMHISLCELIKTKGSTVIFVLCIFSLGHYWLSNERMLTQYQSVTINFSLILIYLQLEIQFTVDFVQ